MTPFAKRLIQWQQRYGRHDLPWQKSPSAYRVWLSEIMLQQTQVTTVIPYFNRFIKALPSLKQLANAPLDHVLHLWSGLGYYSRARNLHKSAQIIQQQHAGRFPKTIEQLQALPGIGRSTAGAIACFAFQQPTVILDGNVKRVLARTHAIEGWYGKAAVLKKYWQIAEQLTPLQSTAIYNQGMMDLGATLCTRSKPKCEACPFQSICIAYLQGETHRYPTPKAKAKTKRIEQRQFLVLFNSQGNVLLYRRPEQGIWGGLWSLPECAIDQPIELFCQQQLGIDIHQIAPGNVRSHQFSHYQLDLHPMKAFTKQNPDDDTHYVWYNSNQDLPGGIAAPIHRLLQEYINEPNHLLSEVA